MAEAQRPVPLPDDATAPYWEAARRGELVVQRCNECSALRFPPQPLCAHCRSFNTGWLRVSGRGAVFSWVVCHPPVLPAFESQLPLLIVLVELEHDPALRLVGNLFDCAPDAVRIGLPVEVTFEALTPEITLPQWRPA